MILPVPCITKRVPQLREFDHAAWDVVNGVLSSRDAHTPVHNGRYVPLRKRVTKLWHFVGVSHLKGKRPVDVIGKGYVSLIDLYNDPNVKEYISGNK